MFRLPLYGVRILDLTMAWAGPYATRLLGDMGAEVIKVEAVNNWDLLRSFTGQPPTVERVWDKSPYFNHVNRDKYGCVLDLSQEKGRELFLRLAEISDVVIENFRAEVMDNLGLTYEALSAVNPQLIVVSMPGHGRIGPERGFIAYGTNVEQLSGLCHLTGYEGGPPQKTGISYGDPVAGIAAAGAIALALWDRRRSGRGQYVEVAQRENLINMIGEQVVAYSMTGREPPRRGNRDSSMAPHGCYPCRGDDQWLTIACEDDAQFAALCRAMGRPELASDARFADVVSRYRNQEALDGEIARWTRERSKEEAAAALQAAEVPASPVLSAPDVFEDAHLRSRGFFESVSHAVAGAWEVEGPHWRFSESPAHIRLPAPAFGEHNGYVFRELLGLSEEEIAELEAQGVTGSTPNWAVHE
ncbi:MAG: CoA transferase [Dehalococcoidia bacterium]|nr:CoA transferase [Dehalococcoidia bacterium]